MPNAFQRRILAERTRDLAARGVAADIHLLPPSLVCIADGRHLALPMALVASIRPFSCQAVPLVKPRAAAIVLGVALFGHRLVSVLDLGRLLRAGGDTGEPPAGGKMILLRQSEPAVALRVQRVLGVMPLRASVEPGRALLPTRDDTPDPPELVTLLAADTLLARVASLDHG